ncbi:MAG: hypothetical protein HDT28_05130 [Clostridiales bacterium]|nr:hypothetical protein [Clostridiales bacterium]
MRENERVSPPPEVSPHEKKSGAEVMRKYELYRYNMIKEKYKKYGSTNHTIPGQQQGSGGA